MSTSRSWVDWTLSHPCYSDPCHKTECGAKTHISPGHCYATSTPAHLSAQSIGDLQEEESTGSDVARRQTLHWTLNNIFSLICLRHCAILIQKPHCTEKETGSRSVINSRMVTEWPCHLQVKNSSFVTSKVCYDVAPAYRDSTQLGLIPSPPFSKTCVRVFVEGSNK